MPFTLDIIPHVPSLDMYGSAKSGTAYSLSGEVVLTLTSPTPPSSLFHASSSTASDTSSTFRPTTIYLSSLLITFEGKVELLSNNCPYAPFRLCQVEKELVGSANDGKPIVLTNSAQSNGIMRWSMIFDLAVPGWLPPSVAIDEHSGSSYAIHAQAKFADDLETAISAMPTSTGSSTPSASRSTSPTPLPSVAGLITSYFSSAPSLPTLTSFNPFALGRSRVKSTNATPVSIRLNRFRAPKSLNPFRGAPEFGAPLVAPQIYHPIPSLFPVALESVETRINMPAEGTVSLEEQKNRIPIETLSNIEVVAGVPEYFGTTEDKIPLSLRIRTTGGDGRNDGLVLEAFDVEVEQTEKFRSIPCERYISAWPVPPASQQPPNKPLLGQSPLASLYTLTSIGGVPDPVQWTRAVPMVPTKKVNFRPSPATGGLEVDGEWAKMDLSIGVLRAGDKEDDTAVGESETLDDEKAGRRLRRKLLNPDVDTPFCKIRHEMKIALRLSWLPAAAAESIQRRYAHVPAGIHRGDKIRKARLAHPDRLQEVLLVSLPMKVVQVSEGVETIFKKLGVHHGAPTSGPMASTAMRRYMAQGQGHSRSASPCGSSAGSMGSMSGRASPANGLVMPGSAGMSRSSTPGLTTSGSPTHSIASLPASSSSSSHGLSIPTPNGPLAYGAAVVSSFPGTFVLPPYSELFHSNGDRKDSVGGGWLPKYTEKDEEAEDTAPAPAIVDSDSEDEAELDVSISV
ncbi:hypothetical protein FRB96_002394 [Tulasnella sp. 330]|nr:hypothetical protein FRB96_002394 [Tulasnella sp. 330]KAG8872187.1 hypothetical protein FRB98_000224 [Tulasnella sp. 332]KAG8883091.1 hypothetical protein FRB97_007228 [Tulasnella sp. 331]